MADQSRFYRSGKKLVRSLPAWLIRFRPFVVYEIPLARPTPAPLASPAPPRDCRESLACDVGWIDDATSAAALRPLASQECIAEWNGTTRRAAAEWLDGQPIACAWIAAESFDEHELGLRFALAPGDAWLYAATVAPEHRDRGVYRQLLEFVIAELRASGARRLLLGVTVGNEPSRRAHARQGAIEIGRVTALRALRRSFCRCTGRVRRVRSRDSASPQLVALTVE